MRLPIETQVSRDGPGRACPPTVPSFPCRDRDHLKTNKTRTRSFFHHPRIACSLWISVREGCRGRSRNNCPAQPWGTPAASGQVPCGFLQVLGIAHPPTTSLLSVGVGGVGRSPGKHQGLGGTGSKRKCGREPSLGFLWSRGRGRANRLRFG